MIGHETVSIELNGQTYAPIIDSQGNVSKLIDPSTNAVYSYDYSAFGEPLTQPAFFNPWQYAQKRFDPDLNLINFGYRYYDPAFARWLTTDPAGFQDSYNLYQYTKNNPFKYKDRYGDSIGGFLIGLGEIVLGGALLVSGCALEVATLGGYTVVFTVQASTGVALMTHGCYYAIDQSKDLSFNTRAYQQASCDSLWASIWKNSDVYTHDRPLPATADGIPIPDTDAPHTQLGTEDGRKGKYPRVREFDGSGQPVRDIDFTDHGRPHNHPNPHQHMREDNPSGGTRSRENPEPVPGWNYI